MFFHFDKYQAFFFDFDGVIVDSVSIKTDAFAALYKPYGPAVVKKVVDYHLSHGGVSRFDKIRHYHRHFLNREISDTEVADLARRFSDLVVDKVVQTPFIKGAEAFLELLHSLGKTMFVISATPEEEIKRIIERKKMGRFFRDVKGAPQSKMDNLKNLLSGCGLEPSLCVYFGDAEQDKQAAAEFKMSFIAVNYFDRSQGVRDFDELMNSVATFKGHGTK